MPISGQFKDNIGFYQRLAEAGMILHAPDNKPNIPVIVEADGLFQDIPTLPWDSCRIPMHEECTFGQLTTLVKRVLKNEEARLVDKDSNTSNEQKKGVSTQDEEDDDEDDEVDDETIDFSDDETKKGPTIFLMVDDNLPGKWDSLRAVYDKHADNDGWLYVTYATQATEPVAVSGSWTQIISGYAWQPVGFLVRLVRG